MPTIETWVAGALVETKEATGPVPEAVSARQIKLALLGAGLLDQVDAFAAGQDRAVRISWEYAVEFRRDDPMLNAMADTFGMSSGDVDGIFRAAAAL